MNMKPVLLKQPQGLGDILFLFKLADHIEKKGHEIIWPMCETYFSQDVHLNLNRFNFVNIDSDFPFRNEYLHAPIAKVTEYSSCIIVATDGCSGQGGTMLSKYNLLGLDYRKWYDYLTFTRNSEKEGQLFYDILGLKDSDDYVVANKYIGTPPHYLHKIYIDVPKDKKIIYVDFYSGYNLFDWCKVFENASELYLEGSAQTYILEKLNLKASSLKLFSRDNHAHFPDDMFSLPWERVKNNIYATPTKLN